MVNWTIITMDVVIPTILPLTQTRFMRTARIEHAETAVRTLLVQSTTPPSVALM